MGSRWSTRGGPVASPVRRDNLGNCLGGTVTLGLDSLVRESKFRFSEMMPNPGGPP